MKLEHNPRGLEGAVEDGSQLLPPQDQRTRLAIANVVRRMFAQRVATSPSRPANEQTAVTDRCHLRPA